MNKPLDVLLVESHPWAGGTVARNLTDAGHTVHRCHEPGDTGFACVGLAGEHDCPLDGHVDAAVLVRSGSVPVPTPHEDGFRCAIRSGIPVVEVGDERTDPYAKWITTRADEDGVAEACRQAIELAKQPIVDAVNDRIEHLLRDAGIDPAGTVCRIEHRWPDLDVAIDVAGPVDRGLEQQVGVRAYDALRAHSSDYKTINVAVRGTPA